MGNPLMMNWAMPLATIAATMIGIVLGLCLGKVFGLW